MPHYFPQTNVVLLVFISGISDIYCSSKTGKKRVFFIFSDFYSEFGRAMFLWKLDRLRFHQILSTYLIVPGAWYAVHSPLHFRRICLLKPLDQFRLVQSQNHSQRSFRVNRRITTNHNSTNWFQWNCVESPMWNIPKWHCTRSKIMIYGLFN